MKKLMLFVLSLSLLLVFSCSSFHKTPDHYSASRLPASEGEIMGEGEIELDQIDFDEGEFDRQIEMHVKDANLSEDEMIQLEEMSKKVKGEIKMFNRAKKDRQQTVLGQVGAAVGKASIQAFTTINRPFMFTGAFLRGYFEKKKEVDTKTRGLVEAWLNKALTWAKNEKEEMVEKLILRLMEGESLSRAELQTIVTLVPELALDEQDLLYWYATWWGGKYIIPMIILKSIGKSVYNPVKKILLRPLLILDLAGMISTIPCINYEPGTRNSHMKNQNLKNYCQEVLEIMEYNMMTSKIKGYLKGRNTKRKHIENRENRRKRKGKE